WLRSNKALAALIWAASIINFLLYLFGQFWYIFGHNRPEKVFMDRRLMSTELNKHQLLKERLLSEYPTLDEAGLRDTLEGLTDLHEMIAAVIRSALVDEALHVEIR